MHLLRHQPTPANPGARAFARLSPPRAFTFLQILIGVFILVITVSLVTFIVSFVRDSLRADRAGREALAALHDARNLAMTTGRRYGVEFSRSATQFRVCEIVGNEFYTIDAADTHRPYVVALSTQPGLAGIALAVPADPFRVAYSPRGATDDIGIITFTCASGSRTITIPAAADAQ